MLKAAYRRSRVKKLTKEERENLKKQRLERIDAGLLDDGFEDMPELVD